ncbi:unnamed protein product [Cochlearia groenlandica]
MDLKMKSNPDQVQYRFSSQQVNENRFSEISIRFSDPSSNKFQISNEIEEQRLDPAFIIQSRSISLFYYLIDENDKISEGRRRKKRKGRYTIPITFLFFSPEISKNGR